MGGEGGKGKRGKNEKGGGCVGVGGLMERIGEPLNWCPCDADCII